MSVHRPLLGHAPRSQLAEALAYRNTGSCIAARIIISYHLNVDRSSIEEIFHKPAVFGCLEVACPDEQRFEQQAVQLALTNDRCKLMDSRQRGATAHDFATLSAKTRVDKRDAVRHGSKDGVSELWCRFLVFCPEKTNTHTHTHKLSACFLLFMLQALRHLVCPRVRE